MFFLTFKYLQLSSVHFIGLLDFDAKSNIMTVLINLYKNYQF